MPGTLDISLGPQLTVEQAEEIYKQGKEAVVFVLLEMAKKLAEQHASPSPSTPSGMVAPYQKPSTNGRGKKKLGRKKGHPGARRNAPEYIHHEKEALKSAVLHADETGWRVNGKTNWLWSFSTTLLTYFMIDRSRGSPALMKFFMEEFRGTLVSDFWGAYNAVVCAQRQSCLVHLLRDLEQVEKYKSPGNNWAPFAKKLRRLIADAIRLRKTSEQMHAEMFASRRRRLTTRLQELIETDWKDPQARRLIKRLRRHQNDLFTFLDKQDVPFDNNTNGFETEETKRTELC